MLCLTAEEGKNNTPLYQMDPSLRDESLIPALDGHLIGDKGNSLFPKLEHVSPEYHQPKLSLLNMQHNPSQCVTNSAQPSALFSDVPFGFHDCSYNFLLDFGTDASSCMNSNNKTENTFDKSLESIDMLPVTRRISEEHSSGSTEHSILDLDSVDESSTWSDPSQCSSYPVGGSDESELSVLLNPIQTEHFLPSGYSKKHDHSYERHYSAPLTTPCKFLMTSVDGNGNGFGYDNQVFGSDSTEAGDLMFKAPGLGSSGVKRQQKTSRGKRKRTQNSNQRKAATVRERRRTGKLNGAFKALKEKVPTFSYESKLSRIETLRLAMTYIGFMTDLLNGQSPNEIKLVPHTSIKGLAALSLDYYD